MLKANCGFGDAEQGRKLLVHHGPAVGVSVGFDPNYRKDQNAPPTLRTFAKIAALIDTGARESCIDEGLVNDLGLTVFDRRPVSGASGILEVDFCLAQLHVPLLKFTLMGSFAAVPLVKSGFAQQALLGRSFLKYFRLEYDGRSGAVEIAIDT
jgi:predicted aspartyl protease